MSSDHFQLPSGQCQTLNSTPSLDPSFACIRCWKLKKKCDKNSPQCNRCSSAGIKCVYSEQPPTGRKLVSHNIHTTTHVPSAAHLQLDNHNARQVFEPPLPKIAIPRFFPGLNNEPPSPDSDSAADNPFSNSNAISRLTAPIYTPFHAIKHEIGEILEVYMQTVNMWLPIITDAQVTHLKNRDGSTPDAETCTLLLTVYLITKQPSEGTNFDSLYTGLKRFHSNLYTISTQSVPIIQAGMLLAIYEQGQSLHQLSYLTIGACVRFAQAIGMHRSIRVEIDYESGRREEMQQHRHMWWCLVILERILSLKHTNDIPPFASSDPTLNDYVPSYWPHSPSPDGAVFVGNTSNPYTKFPEIDFPETNPLAKCVQALYLLTKVLEHVNNAHQTDDARQAGADYLDLLLQGFMGRAMKESRYYDGEKWHHSCVPFYVLMCALLRLHNHTLAHTNYGTNPSFTSSSARSILAIEMIARIGTESLDTAKEFDEAMQDKFLNEFHMPPFLLTATRDVSLVALQMTRYKVGEEDFWRSIVTFYMESFRLAGKKWRLADEYLDVVIREESML